MRKSLKDGIVRSVCLVLMLMHSDALREHFNQSSRMTWAGARNHCQVCFKELVTLTPENIQGVASDLVSDSWIGLRKNSTSNSSHPWIRWANGDPLVFQNWYPGWPVFKTPKPQTTCCSCSCTCPVTTATTTTTTAAAKTTASTGTWATGTGATASGATTTGATAPMTPATYNYYTGSMTHTSTEPPPTEAQCVKSPMLPSNVSEPEDRYIEDACVAMLSFGPWVERNCSDLLPFICQDDRFVGNASVSELSHNTANLTWQQGPSNVSHYRVEVNGSVVLQTSDALTLKLTGLTAGTRYSVQVFAVKCGRDLAPQNVSFYTQPRKVKNLNVTAVMATSVVLIWSKPAGNLDFYVVRHGEKETPVYKENMRVVGLTPGTGYTFTLRSGVNGTSVRSEESSITVFTKPGKVSNLSVSENTNVSLSLRWTAPKGNVSAFRVRAVDDNKNELYNQDVKCNRPQAVQNVTVTNLPVGTRITLTVASLANTTRGDEETVVSFTTPGPVSNLKLVTSHHSLHATWQPPAGYSPSSASFNVTLQLDGEDQKTKGGLTQPKASFDGLKTAANYTVTVWTVSGHLRSPPMQASKFTLPQPPTNLTVISSNETEITLKWTAPANTGSSRFMVNLTSSFWGRSEFHTVDRKDTYTFRNLISGSRYHFTVQTVTDKQKSSPLRLNHSTAAEEREISLSMMCSSPKLLLCANDSTRDSVFGQLKAKFQTLFGDHVFWKLEKEESEQTRV